ncbi:MAG: 2-dehydro-3-deoxyphosphooctonate aldolase [Cyanobacteriota bacterium erpe_2018_sw_39hr_WHONDRS-SW48-000098_B_bin.30]|jgi:2-dehydro-3-deoxyphosphooctonate aldolase (KDO 8-P synthase)|nr:3-deoxy-8-phosphooctulonate synthase [Candidatus Obscuribacter sp.]MBK7839226.1 3-deoxy-8-phosphooctulonate synthase [Candidatus Obscuribacter sp.]MBK9203170.1 3-deoxy-8-phosphooctulonate synthase [Candidatus Obscuribacter sp.]MBK9619282.1 3-deoxy-8-phosphooctulonate synthase [Candidatus Obscuribacter sp.]MDQ5966478.1 2-dehydro-3-deoxyphosphooctonate aldolase [Cyanobacteriota bacterium erpe_2018_sw_39hr_WHONDRS-SW48-000098_B_bin.30]
MTGKTVKIGNAQIGNGGKFLIIAGPCVIESYEVLEKTAKHLQSLSKKYNFEFVFKSSFDKANRTSVNGFRGPGLKDGLAMLADIKRNLGLPLLSDVHETEQCEAAGEVLDILQIPAFLCRQTDLIVAAAKTGKCVNIKKGQFAAPGDMKNAVKKIVDSGNENILLTERGASFGYNNLVVDFRSIPIMKESGYPVIFDATHSVQLPGGAGDASSGQRQYIPTLARAAVVAGCDGMFMEVHPNPDEAKSDAANQVPLMQVEELLAQVLKLREVYLTLPEINLPAPGQCKQLAAI